MKVFPLVLVLLAAPVAAAAQSTPSPAPAASPAPSAIGPALFANDPCTTLSAIVTRPTVTNAVCTVRPNHVEIEGGYQNTTYPGSGNSVAFPQALIRVGTAVLGGLEVQVTPPNYVRTSTGGAAVAGAADSGFGLKYTLGATPKLVYGVQVNYTAPTGTAAFSANANQSIYAAQASYTLSPVFSLTAGAQDQILAANGVSYGSFVPSLVLGASLPASFSAYVEGAEFTHALGPGTPTRTQYIYGVSRGIGQRLQLDLEAGFSPTNATGRYHYVGFGFGYYF